MNGDSEENHDMAEDTDRRPETALGEVLREVEDAEKRVTDDERDKHRRGEAGEAITPNVRAEEESQGD
ncbi:hypothetical protein [Streptomyces sp. NPDC014006]|uniref:hypothetical protein n=1 Tax=Streptomyces sp. NPDC014006 TaxID=3364870 RepID=UPI0037015103